MRAPSRTAARPSLSSCVLTVHTLRRLPTVVTTGTATDTSASTLVTQVCAPFIRRHTDFLPGLAGRLQDCPTHTLDDGEVLYYTPVQFLRWKWSDWMSQS